MILFFVGHFKIPGHHLIPNKKAFKKRKKELQSKLRIGGNYELSNEKKIEIRKRLEHKFNSNHLPQKKMIILFSIIIFGLICFLFYRSFQLSELPKVNNYIVTQSSKDSVRHYVNLSEVYLFNNRYSEAEKALKKAVKFDTQNIAIIKLAELQAELCYKFSDYCDEAKANLKKAKTHYPDYQSLVNLEKMVNQKVQYQRNYAKSN